LGRLIFVVDVQSKLEVLKFLKCVAEIDILIQIFDFIYKLLSIFVAESEFLSSYPPVSVFLLLVATYPMR